MENYNFLYQKERIPIEYRTNRNKAIELFNFIKENNIITNNQYLYSLATWVGVDFKNYRINEEFSEIEKIEILEPEETYDLEIKNDHSYVANGMICHNTHNLPENISLDEVNKIYFQAWKSGCKGCTIYREGSRQGVLITKKEEEFKTNHAPKRPKELKSDYYVVTANGIKYAVIIGLWKDTNKPYEIFAFENPPMDKNTKGRTVKVKKNQYKFINGEFEIDNLQLAAERVEQRAHTIYLSMLLRHGAPIGHIVHVAKKVDENITSFSSACRRVLSKYVAIETLQEKCPRCGGNLIREEGCVHCDSCEYSKC